MNKYILSAGLLAAVFFTNNVMAKDLAQELKQCKQHKDSLSRLLCYDELTQSLDNTESTAGVELTPQNKKPVLAAKAPVQETKQEQQDVESSFGIEHKEKAAIDEIIMTITKAKKNKYGKWRLTLENGQVWEQSSDNRSLKFRVGDTVTVKRGLFNSFKLSKAGLNSEIRVKRIK